MRLAVLASGSGSILAAIAEAGVPVALVVVDRPCAALGVAARYGIAGRELTRTDFTSSFDRDAYTAEVTAALVAEQIDVVAMAGFGTILGPAMYEKYGGRVLNTHPSLLPAFPGWHAVRAALDHGVMVTGCTVHLATLEVDSGPILAQEAVTVGPGDTEETLHERIKEVERRLYPETIRRFLERNSAT